jgi:hypothetical protein
VDDWAWAMDADEVKSNCASGFSGSLSSALLAKSASSNECNVGVMLGQDWGQLGLCWLLGGDAGLLLDNGLRKAIAYFLSTLYCVVASILWD